MNKPIKFFSVRRLVLIVGTFMSWTAVTAATQIAVNSLAELKPYLEQSDVSVKLAPGEYRVAASDVSSGLIGKFWKGSEYLKNSFNVFLFEGDNSTYDFTGVTVFIETQVAQSVGRVDVYEVRTIGNGNVIKDLTVVDDGSVHDQPTFRATNVVLDGANNRLEGCHFTVKGSYPYGYGDIFGKSGRNIINHNKRSACLIRGKSNLVKDSTFICRSYGHGIFFQGAENPMVDGCTVEGEIRSISEVLAEAGTGSPADKVDFRTIFGFNLRDLAGDYYFSCQEDGIRSYNAGETIIDGVEYKRGVTDPIVKNSKVVKMRSGVTIGWAAGSKYVENCTALACETGYWVGSNTKVVNSKGDASIGALLSEDAGRKGSTIVLTLVDNYVEPLDGAVTDIYYAGSGHTVTLYDATTYDHDIEIVIGGERLAHRFMPDADNDPLNFDARDITFTNNTKHSVSVGDKARNIKVITNSKVMDKGAGTKVTPLGESTWIDRNKNGRKDHYENPDAPIQQRIDDLLSRMTLEEKTCQMGTIYGYNRVLKNPQPTEKWKSRVWKDGVANIDEHCNGVRGEQEFIGHVEHGELLNEIQRWFIDETRLGLPVDFTNEGIRGLCHAWASNFPSQLGVGATFDKDLVRRIGEITGEEARALGYTNIYSPILDVVRDPRWGRTVECYGESPFLVGELGKQQSLGLQSKGVASTLKHFAAYSHPNGGRDARGRTDPQIPYRDMHEILMHPFQKVFTEADPKGTMSSYNTYDGVPVTGSSYFLTELLRDEYGFNGYVVSDSGAVSRLQKQHGTAASFEDAVVAAVNAGLNVRTNFQKMEKFVEPLREAVKKNRISEATLNSRVADVLRVKFELGLFDQPFVDAAKAPEIVHRPENEAVTLEAARKAMVLLKNEGGALPLDRQAIKTVLVTGPGSNDVHPMISRYGPGQSDVITPLAGIRDLLKGRAEVLHANGVDYRDARFPGSDILPELPNSEEQAELDKALALAESADVIIAVVGDDHSTVGESRSRTSLDLPGHQLHLVQEMVKTGKPVVVVLMAGRAASINWIDQNIPGVLVCWHGGEKVGQAVAETLFGDYNPGGRLPITFPQTAGQIPLAFPHRNGAWGAQNRSADENGWGSTRLVGPLYHFGHGLSYTTFEYSSLTIDPAEPTAKDTITITCDVTNTGERGGDEVVQLYVKDVVASVAPFDKVLRGFERVTVAPGETQKVSFQLQPQRDLKMLGLDKQWVVEPGEFKVMLGASSSPTAVKQEGSFILK
ncbi:MAG: glycoside hydrolase family 3 N-terminal domain-containing protein [Opitutaceae bacterium]